MGANEAHALVRVPGASGEPFGPSLGEPAQLGIVDDAVEDGGIGALRRLDAAPSMARAMLVALLLALSACSSIPPLDGDIIIHARTPIVAVGKWNNGKPTCAVAIEYDGKTVVFWGAFGCGVVHREVVVPAYHDEGARP